MPRPNSPNAAPEFVAMRERFTTYPQACLILSDVINDLHRINATFRDPRLVVARTRLRKVQRYLEEGK